MAFSRGTTGVGYVGHKRATAAVRRRGTEGVGEARLPESTGPVLIPPAPSFPGMNYAQFIPANLVLDGTLELNDPIGNLPLYGDLIPGGSFIASGSARPIVADNGTGRVGMQLDGVDDMPEITGLSLDLTGGCTWYCVSLRDVVSAGRGLIRGDAGSSGANDSYLEAYHTGLTGNFSARTRTPTTAVVGASWPQTLESQGFVTGASGGTIRDGVLTAGTLTRPSEVIQRIQIAGYDTRLFVGFAYTWILYNAEHTPAQRLVVRDYLRDQFNGGAAF